MDACSKQIWRANAYCRRGGTLTPADMGFYDMREETRYEVPEAVLSTLRMLCADPSNHVMILSGLGRDKASTCRKCSHRASE